MCVSCLRGTGQRFWREESAPALLCTSVWGAWRPTFRGRLAASLGVKSYGNEFKRCWEEENRNQWRSAAHGSDLKLKVRSTSTSEGCETETHHPSSLVSHLLKADYCCPSRQAHYLCSAIMKTSHRDPTYGCESSRNAAVSSGATPVSLTALDHSSHSLDWQSLQQKFMLTAWIQRVLLEDMQSNNATIVRNAMCFLVNLSLQSQEHRNKIYSMGGHAIVLTVMKKWPHHETIQICGCSFFMALTYECPKATLGVARVGGIGAMASAAKNFPQSLQVQQSAIGAVSNFSSHIRSEDEIRSAARRLVHEFGGIELIVSTMTRFPNNAEVQLWSIGALHGLCGDSTCEVSITRNAQVAMAVHQAIRRHPDDTKIQTRGSLFFSDVLGEFH
jgi:hypothetical protein